MEPNISAVSCGLSLAKISHRRRRKRAHEHVGQKTAETTSPCRDTSNCRARFRAESVFSAAKANESQPSAVSMHPDTHESPLDGSERTYSRRSRIATTA